MPETMAKFRCWSAESVARTVFSDIGALAGDADAVFLAAHTPVNLKQEKGRELKASASGEAQVLEALTSRVGDLERNTLVAVTGGSGSGKSHVVRWVHSHLDRQDPRYRVLYVPRAVQTLRDLLRRIIEGLPGVEGSTLMDRVDHALSNVRPGELQERLVNEIQIALNWRLDDSAPFDGETPDEAAAREDRNNMLGIRNRETGGREAGLAELIDIREFKETLLRPDGHLSQLVHSYFDETSRRDDNEQIFTTDDLPLKARGVQGALRGNRDLLELWQLVRQTPTDALELLEQALRVALRRVVGLDAKSGDTLDSLFRESRRALREQGQELILIFEDLAQFGLVDGELYDQFVTQPGNDLAPLRVVFAVTDGAYGRMERTVRTRVEYEFRVDGSALADPAQFMARYLNLVRVGREETLEHGESTARRRDGEHWMVNACDTREQGRPCRFRDRCHAAFGSVAVEGLGDVGLYPYNASALDRAYQNLGGNPTPRDVLDECVSTILVEADSHIAEGDYPHARTWTQFKHVTSMAKDVLIAAHPSSDPERNYRTLVIWGNEAALDTSVLEAFSLDPPPMRRPQGEAPKRAVTTRPALPRPEQELPNPLLPLFQWQNGDSLPQADADYYRDALRNLVADRLNLDQYLVNAYRGQGKELLESLFNRTSINIEGARGRVADQAKSVVFELHRTADDVQLLAAAHWFRDHGHFDTSRPKWQWPTGYDPVDLMLSLEVRLDAWASVVRERLLNEAGGSRIAQLAVGVRAVALAVSGQDISQLGSATDVLRSPTMGGVPASQPWLAADAAALRAVSALKTEEYIGDFAAVRQGADGQPQLVDPNELDDAISAFLSDPEANLSEAANSTVFPAVAQHARQLLDAVRASAEATIGSAQQAHEAAVRMLQGHTPLQIARLAEEVGTDARNAGFFRPTDKWHEFLQAVNVLNAATQPDVETAPGGSLAGVIREQKALRDLDRLANALSFVEHAMTETKRESERSGTTAGDVSRLQAAVKEELAELAAIMKALGPGGVQ